jgi:hypothetical protein
MQCRFDGIEGQDTFLHTSIELERNIVVIDKRCTEIIVDIRSIAVVFRTIS